MNAPAILIASLALALSAPAFAQKADTRKPAGPVTKYLQLDGVTYQKVALSVFEGQVKLSMQGGKTTGGVLDACMAPDTLTNRVDRLTGNLELKGTTLFGSGRSQVGGKAWSIEIQQSKTPEGIKAEGRIEYAGKSYPFSNDGITLSDEPTLFDGEGEVDASAPASDPKSLNQVEVDVPAMGLPDLLRVLSEEGASLHPGAVTPGCAGLRTGIRTIKVIAAPDRAEALVARINATKGLAARMEDEFLTTSRVRLPAGETPSAYGEQGERSLATKVAASATATIPGLAIIGAPTRSPATGRWRVVMERPGDLGAGVPLRERDTLTFTVGRSSETKDRGIVVIEELSSSYVIEPGKGGAMTLESPDSTSDGVVTTELMTGPATDAIRDALARSLGGDVTDAETGKWVPIPKAP